MGKRPTIPDPIRARLWPERKPDTSPERLEEIRRTHDEYRHRTHYTEGFQAVEDLLAMIDSPTSQLTEGV